MRRFPATFAPRDRHTVVTGSSCCGVHASVADVQLGRLDVQPCGLQRRPKTRKATRIVLLDERNQLLADLAAEVPGDRRIRGARERTNLQAPTTLSL